MEELSDISYISYPYYKEPLRMVSPGSSSETEAWIAELAADRSTMVGKSIHRFILCTQESKEKNPYVIMRNIRQFLTGISKCVLQLAEENYVKVGFISLEKTLSQIIVSPLSEKLNHLLLKEHMHVGAMQWLAHNMERASYMCLSKLGVRSNIHTPSDQCISNLCKIIRKMQTANTPVEKVENLIEFFQTIFQTITPDLTPDDLLGLLMFVLSRCKLVTIGLDLDYMQGLLHPIILSGEWSIYFSYLFKAVQMLNNYRSGYNANILNAGTSQKLEDHYRETDRQYQGPFYLTTSDEERSMAHE